MARKGEDPRVAFTNVTVGRDLILHVEEGPRSRAFTSKIAAFTEDHLSTVLAGRDEELGFLDSWVEGRDAPPRMLITAPGGRGKSTLIVHWLDRLRARGVVGPHRPLVFVPISARHGTHTPETYLQSLAVQLAEILEQRVDVPTVSVADSYADVVHGLISELVRTRRECLIVCDGLDESVARTFGAHIVPQTLTRETKVLFSARQQEGDLGAEGWVRRLEWDGVKRVRLELEPFTRHAIERFASGAAWWRDASSLTRESCVDAMEDVSEGEPLVLRFILEDVKNTPATEIEARLAGIRLGVSGIDAYFGRWFEIAESSPEWHLYEARRADAILALLAWAAAPIALGDLVQLLEHVKVDTSEFTGRSFPLSIRRLVVGDGTESRGYVLTHPKLSEYLRNTRYAHLRPKIEAAYAAWVIESVGRINDGGGGGSRPSFYIVRFGERHLEALGGSPAVTSLVKNGWRRFLLERGELGSFIRQVEFVLRSVKDDPEWTQFVEQFRCRLVLASIQSAGRETSAELLLALAECGIAPFRECWQRASLMKRDSRQVEALLLLANSSKAPENDAESMLRMARARADQIADKDEAVAAMAHLSAGDKHHSEQWRQRAIDTAASVESWAARATLLRAAAVRLGDIVPSESTRRQRFWLSRRTSELVKRSDPSLRLSAEGLIDLCLNHSEEGRSAYALAEVMPLLSNQAVEHVMHNVTRWKWPIPRARVYAAGVPVVASDGRNELLRACVDAIKELNIAQNIELVEALAPFLSQELASELRTVAVAHNAWIRGSIDLLLLNRVTAPLRTAVLADIRSAAHELNDGWFGLVAIMGSGCGELAVDVMESARRLSPRRGATLIASLLRQGVCDPMSCDQVALEVALKCHDSRERAEAIVEIAAAGVEVPEDRLDESMGVIAGAIDNSTVAGAVLSLSTRARHPLQQGWRDALVEAVGLEIGAVENAEARARAVRVTEQVDSETRSAAIRAGLRRWSAIGDSYDRVLCLRDLLNYAKGESSAVSMARGFIVSAALSCERPDERAAACIAALPFADDRTRGKLRDEVRGLESEMLEQRSESPLVDALAKCPAELARVVTTAIARQVRPGGPFSQVLQNLPVSDEMYGWEMLASARCLPALSSHEVYKLLQAAVASTDGVEPGVNNHNGTWTNVGIAPKARLAIGAIEYLGLRRAQRNLAWGGILFDAWDRVSGVTPSILKTIEELAEQLPARRDKAQVLFALSAVATGLRRQASRRKAFEVARATRVPWDRLWSEWHDAGTISSDDWREAWASAKRGMDVSTLVELTEMSSETKQVLLANECAQVVETCPEPDQRLRGAIELLEQTGQLTKAHYRPTVGSAWMLTSRPTPLESPWREVGKAIISRSGEWICQLDWPSRRDECLTRFRDVVLPLMAEAGGDAAIDSILATVCETSDWYP